MTILRRCAKSLAFAALGAAGFLSLGGVAHAGPYGHKPYVHDGARCVAGAKTAIGSILPGTRKAAVRPGFKGACSIALNRCARSLDKKRIHDGFAYPFARCQILDRGYVSAGYGGPKEVLGTRCVAKGFTRNGLVVHDTRAAETRRYRKRACSVALNKCEKRLDYKRRVIGHNLPYARCKVTKTKQVALGHHGKGHNGFKGAVYRY